MAAACGAGGGGGGDGGLAGGGFRGHKHGEADAGMTGHPRGASAPSRRPFSAVGSLRHRSDSPDAPAHAEAASPHAAPTPDCLTRDDAAELRRGSTDGGEGTHDEDATRLEAACVFPHWGSRASLRGPPGSYSPALSVFPGPVLLSPFPTSASFPPHRSRSPPPSKPAPHRGMILRMPRVPSDDYEGRRAFGGPRPPMHHSRERSSIGRASRSAPILDLRLRREMGLPVKPPRPPSTALPVEELQEEFVSGELPPPPPPPPLPEECAIYYLTETRQALEIPHASIPSRERYRVSPATRPTSRSEVRQLSEALERMLDEAGGSTALALQAWDQAFAELVRQVFVQCADRGELLGRVRRAYGHYFSELVHRLRALEATKREQQLHYLQEENRKLLEELGREEGSQHHVADVRRGVAQATALLGAQALGEKKRDERSTLTRLLDKFVQATPLEREKEWEGLLRACPADAQAGMLDRLWTVMSEERKLEAVRRLLADMAADGRAVLVEELAERLPLEERNVTARRLLCQLTAHQMDRFCDLLPSIWGELSFLFTARLVNRLPPLDRKLFVLQINKVPEDDTRDLVPLSRGEHDKDVSLIPVSKLDTWRRYVATAEDEAALAIKYRSEQWLSQVASRCYEAALIKVLSCGHLVLRSGEEPTRLDWAKLVYGTLLRRNTPSPKEGCTTAQCARTELLALLAVSRTLPSHRSRVFARMCGVFGRSFSQDRVDRVLVVLAALFSRRSDTPASAAKKALSASKSPKIPLDGDDGYRPALRSIEKELGGAKRVDALLNQLEAAARPDVRTGVPGVELDAALILLLDEHDIACSTNTARLGVVFQKMGMTGDVRLDLELFAAIVRVCQPSASDELICNVFIDCAELAKEASPLTVEGQEVITPTIFSAVCQRYGIEVPEESQLHNENESE